MNIGRFQTEQLSEGFYEIFNDGTLQKMEPHRMDNLKEDTSLGKYSSAIGVDPLFITDGNVNILLDAGLGWGLDHNSHYNKISNSVTNLEIFGITPEMIDFVILSHLHYDHAAGSTYMNRDLETTVTFPNAEYLVQEKEWAFACSHFNDQNDVNGIGYSMDELYRLAAEKRFHFIDKEKFELIPGIGLLRSGGHTPGHQVVRISDEGKDAYYLGDLIPTEYDLNHYAMKQMDHDPLQSKKFKTRLLREAFETGACLFFYHSLFRKSGKLERDEHRKYMLREG
ncbi:MAG: MBL fold metallo-hydrolase [Balneolaceae bacterium]